MIGAAVNAKFAGTNVGESIRLVGTDWPVVGIFDAGRSGFSSEIWGDVEVLMPSFKREQFSSITLKLRPGADFEALTQRLENDRRLTVEVQRETEFYEDQSNSLGTFIRIMGTFISVIFSIGAIVGAMITMYSSVANRTREIGILRAIGFSKGSILRAFVQESLLIAFIGGITGIAFASLLTFASISTTNFDTFADLSFGFSITPGIVLNGLIFSLIMGVLGGALPAYRASRTHILTALRS
jgi:ABC-type antimicrobial peptide transport system permease subunit